MEIWDQTTDGKYWEKLYTIEWRHVSAKTYQITEASTVVGKPFRDYKQRNHKGPHYRPFVREIIGDRMNPLVKDEWRGKRYHVVAWHKRLIIQMNM